MATVGIGGRPDMTRVGAPPLGWSAFVAAGVVAAMLPGSVQLAFAALAVIGLGLPHGASDLALVPAERRAGFLLAYVGLAAVVVAVWLVSPALALVAFLLVSVVHFALDDRSDWPALRWAIGAIIVVGPALFHGRQVDALFRALVDDAGFVVSLGTVMRAAAAMAAGTIGAALLVRGGKHGESWWLLLSGAGAALALPPLVGFAVGFVLLHARGQTRERMAALGCATSTDFLLRIAPVMVGALGVIAAVALVFAHHASPAIGTLFAALSALAAPHMLVTPSWLRERRHPSGRARWTRTMLATTASPASSPRAPRA